MRVGFWATPASLWFEGGAKIQIRKTQEVLENKGINVIHLSPWRNLVQEDIDIVHCFGGGSETLTVLQVAKSYQIPVVFFAFGSTRHYSPTFRSAQFIKSFINNRVIRPQFRHLTDLATFIICASHAHARLVSALYGVPLHKFRVVPLGVDVERFLKASPELFMKTYGLKDFILQVATVRRLKGQIKLCKALRGEGLQVVFIGPLMSTEHDYVAEFLNVVEKNKEWVKYLGPIEHEDPLLASAFAAARVHVLPSEREGLGLVNLEAAAAGCAVVSGRYPGLSEYLGEHWFPCEPASIPSIRKAVWEAYEIGGSKELRERVQQFSWDKVVDRLIEVYQEAIEVHKQC